MTEDVSFGGMFVCTDAAPPVGRLLRLLVELPGEKSAARMHAKVVHRRRRGPGRAAGLGLEFYGIDDRQRAAWVRYVQDVCNASGDPGGSEKTARAVATGSGKTYAAVLEIRVPSKKGLLRMYARDIALGGTFIETPKQFAVGEEIYIVIVHPETERVFGIRCVVRRTIRQRHVTGVAVEFVAMDEPRRRAFWSFIGPGRDEADPLESKVVVDPDDMLYRPSGYSSRA